MQGDRGRRALVQCRQKIVVVAEVGAGQHLRRREGVQFGQDRTRVGVVELCHLEPARRHVGDREAVAVALAATAAVVADHGGEMLGAVVAGGQVGSRRHNSGYLAGVAVGGLVLVRDGDPIAAFDQRGDVGGEVVHGDAGHRVFRAVGGLLAHLQVQLVGHQLGVVVEELVEVPTLHRENVGVGPLLEREELTDDARRLCHIPQCGSGRRKDCGCGRTADTT